VFTKFYRDDRVLAQRGTGLGLFIVREVVNALGGRVDMAVSNGVVTAQIELGNML
jgi:signal transduction histidine kinase